MKNPPKMFAGVCLLLALPVGIPLLAQSSAVNGIILGTVTDSHGVQCPNALVEVTNTAISLTRTALTDELGRYRFTLLPIGEYSIVVSAAGLARVESGGIRLNAGSAVTEDFRLAVANVEQTIANEKGEPLLETARTDLGTTLDFNDVQSLPLTSRNNLNFVLLQPGLSGHENGQFGLPDKVGTGGLTNRIHYQLDGSNNSESDVAGVRLMPISNTWVEEVQQQGGGFVAEFGNSAGAVYNAVTRSGTNDLNAEIAYLMRRTPFDSRSALLSDAAPDPQTDMDNVYGDAGFPIIHNRLFVFAGYEWLQRDLPQPVTVDPGVLAALSLPVSFGEVNPRSQANEFEIGRADWQWNDRNRVFVRYNAYEGNTPYSGMTSSLQVRSQTYTMEDSAPAVAAQWISSMGPGLAGELRFQVPARNTDYSTDGASSHQPAIVIPGVISFGGSESLGYRFNEKTPEVAGNLTYSRGPHVWKAGFSLRWVLDNYTSPAYAQYTFASVSDYLAAQTKANPLSYQNFTQTIGRPTIGYDSLFSGAYVEDTWRVRPGLTLNTGLRWDLYRVPGGIADAAFAWSQNFRSDYGNFAPRAGLAWSPGRSGRTVIRLNGGLFYDPPQTDIYRRALQDDGRPRLVTVATGPDAPFAPLFPNILRSVPAAYGSSVLDITTVDPHFRPLHAAEWSAQVSHQLAENTALILGYLGVKGTALPVYRDINLAPSGQTLADGRPIFGDARVWPQFNNILSAESVGNSTYNAFTATVRRRLSSFGEYSLSYTWSHAIDDAPEQNVLDSTALLPSDASNRARDRGDSPTDRRHALTAYGVIEPHFRLAPGLLDKIGNHNRFAYIFTLSSGDVFDMGSNRVLNGDPSVPASLQRPLFVGRDTIRGPILAQVDFRYSRIIPIWERLQSELFIEASNLLNRANITGLNTIANVSPAGQILTPPTMQPTATLDPRVMLIGIRLSY